MSKPILAVDFDGVLHSYESGWVEADFIPDPPVSGAIEWLIEASQHFEIHIYSSRSASRHGIDQTTMPLGIRAMRTWLHYWGRKWTGGNMALLGKFNQMFNDLRWPEEKPPAFVTLDDRAITFEGSWPDPKELKEFRPWNKR